MSYVDKRLQLLTIQPFRWYVLSCLFAMIGNGLAYVTMAWLVIGKHNAVSSVAILMLCFWIPMVILGPINGVLADKFNRKFLMIISVCTRGFTLLSVAWILTWDPSTSVLYALGVIQGICFSLYSPAAMAAIREFLPPNDLLHANTLIDIVYEVGSMIGMGSAGLLIELISGAGTIMIDGLLFLAAAAALFMIRYPVANSNHLQEEKRGFITNLMVGLRYLLQHKNLCVIYTIQLFIFITFVTAPILSAPYAKSVLHASVKQFGIIEAMLSVGVIVGGILSPYVAQIFGVKRIVIGEIFLLAVCLLLFGMNHEIFWAEILYFFIGLFLSVWPLILTRAQELTEFSYQGRVHSTFFSISGVVVLIVYFAANFAGDYVSIHNLYLVQVIMLLFTGSLAIYFRRVFDRHS